MSNCKGCGVRWNYKPEHLDYCVGCANEKLSVAVEALGVYHDIERANLNHKDALVVLEQIHTKAREALKKIGGV